MRLSGASSQLRSQVEHLHSLFAGRTSMRAVDLPEERLSSLRVEQPSSKTSSSLQPPIAVDIIEDSNEKVINESLVEPSAATKIEFLDGIRGAAVILVVCQHVGYLRDYEVGALGVHTFFVLSSFLLTMILDKKFRMLYIEGAAPRRWGYALTDYAVKRVLRVYPLFALVAIAVSLSSDKHKHQWFHVDKSILGDHWDLSKVLTFDPQYRFFMLWTLPLELTYYLIIPVLVTVLVVLQRWWWMPVLPLTGWILYTGLYQVRHWKMGLAPHLPTFVCGSLAAVVYNRIAEHIKTTGLQFNQWHRIALQAIEAVVVLLLVSDCFDAMVFDWFGPSPFRLPQSDHFVSLHVSIIIVCETLQPSTLSKMFEWCLLRSAGKISFSVYLLHTRVIYSDFVKAQKNHGTHFFCVWILVFFWGTVSYQLVEKPCQRLAAWIGRKIKTLDMDAKAKQHHALYA